MQSWSTPPACCPPKILAEIPDGGRRTRSHSLQSSLSQHLQKLFLRTHVDGLCHQFTVAVIYEAFRNTLNLKEVIDLFCRDQAARDRIRNLSLKSILPLIIESGCIRTCRSCKRFTHVPLNNTARFGACTTDVLYYRRYARPQCARAMHICHFGPLPEIR